MCWWCSHCVSDFFKFETSIFCVGIPTKISLNHGVPIRTKVDVLRKKSAGWRILYHFLGWRILASCLVCQIQKKEWDIIWTLYAYRLLWEPLFEWSRSPMGYFADHQVFSLSKPVKILNNRTIALFSCVIACSQWRLSWKDGRPGEVSDIFNYITFHAEHSDNLLRTPRRHEVV